jgi:erythromycin esterase
MPPPYQSALVKTGNIKSLRIVLSLILAVAFSKGSSAQDIETYVKQNSVAVRSIDTGSSDYSDLEALGNAIGDARVVMLGEQDHGDAPAFLAKTRLIRYLREKKGFNVLAFESDFFGLNYGWDHANKSAVYNFLQRNIFPIWTLCDACRYLFKNYIPQTQTTSTPLQVSGFDNQMVLNISATLLTRKLDSVLRSQNLPITSDPEYSSQILPLVDSFKKYKLSNEALFDKQRSYLLRIRDELGKRLPSADFWMMVIENLLSCNSQYRPVKDVRTQMQFRDEQMAKNLLWLVTVKYPNEKIIVWAQNGHISRYGHFNDKWEDKLRYMGTVFDDIKDTSLKTYVLGFTSGDGEAGRLGTKTSSVTKPLKKSFESWVPDTLDYAFTDLSAFRHANPSADVTFMLKGLGHSYLYKRSEWHKIFDGIFFIRKMYPCKPDKP